MAAVHGLGAVAGSPLVFKTEEIDMTGSVVSSGWFKTGVAAMAGALIASVATVSITEASGAGSGTFTACVTPATGVIKILSDPAGPTGASCASGEEVTWSQEGPQGPQGAQGAGGSPAGLGASSSAIDAQFGSADGDLAVLASQLQGEHAQDLALFQTEQRFLARHIPGFAKDRSVALKFANPSAEELREAKLSAKLPGTTQPSVAFALAKPTTQALEGDLDSMTELSEMASINLQMEMDQRTKLEDTLSNVLKKIADTGDSIVQNLK